MSLEIVLLCLVSVAAGAINSIAGGGTLLTFPVLMAILSRQYGTGHVALAAVVANQTNTVSLVPGSLAAAIGYRRELVHSRRWLWWLIWPCLGGGTIGALLLIILPAGVFESLVPWLILAAALLFALQPKIASWTGIGREHAHPSAARMAAIVLLQLAVSVYGGYFGAGIGILMLAALALMGMADIHAMNALKNVMAAAINMIAALIFIVRGQVEWHYALPMIISAVIGGYLGAALALKVDRGLVRRIVVVIGFSLAAFYFYRQLTA